MVSWNPRTRGKNTRCCHGQINRIRHTYFSRIPSTLPPECFISLLLQTRIFYHETFQRSWNKEKHNRKLYLILEQCLPCSLWPSTSHFLFHLCVSFQQILSSPILNFINKLLRDREPFQRVQRTSQETKITNNNQYRSILSNTILLNFSGKKIKDLPQANLSLNIKQPSNNFIGMWKPVSSIRVIYLEAFKETAKSD